MTRKILVIGGRCFEDDVEKFIEALRPSKIEKKALQFVLAKITEPVIIDSGTASAVLSLHWDGLGEGAINAVIDDPDLSRGIFKRTSGFGLTPSQVLRDADSKKKAADALGQLPDLSGLSKLSKYADEVVRTYRAYGMEEVLKVLERGQSGETKMKSLTCGFHDAMGNLKGKEWLFTKEELDYGKYLSKFAKELLDSQPEEYREKLQNLMTASGSGETI